MRFQPNMQGLMMPGAAAFPQAGVQAQAPGQSQVLGYLGRALSLEFSAGQHYLAQASLAKYRGEMHFAENFVTLANEEFQHSNLLTDRMVAYGALPAGSVLSPATPANSIAEALRSCEARELALIQLYGEAVQFSQNIGASDDFALFSRLLEEEQSQLMRVNAWLEEYYQSLTTAHQPTRAFV